MVFTAFSVLFADLLFENVLVLEIDLLDVHSHIVLKLHDHSCTVRTPAYTPTSLPIEIFMRGESWK